MATLTMPEAFLQDVIEHRDDDAPRLIFADWLEEHGDGARAEFIRMQCALARHEAAVARRGDSFPAPPLPEGFIPFSRREALRRRERELAINLRGWALAEGVPESWHVDYRGPEVTGLPPRVFFRRGFVAEITCTLDAFYGGPCWLCGGRGGTDGLEKWDCPDCRGTGRTPGHGPALVRAAPLEYVSLSDREPQNYHNNPSMPGHDGPLFGWCRETDGRYGLPYNLPPDLWDRVAEHPRRIDNGQWADFRKRADAIDALGEGLLDWANAQPATS